MVTKCKHWLTRELKNSDLCKLKQKKKFTGKFHFRTRQKNTEKQKTLKTQGKKLVENSVDNVEN